MQELTLPVFVPFEHLPFQSKIIGLAELADVLEANLMNAHHDGQFFGQLQARISRLGHCQPDSQANRKTYEFLKSTLGQLVEHIEHLETISK